jgi:tetratricopeptide (TPR) repeat protein
MDQTNSSNPTSPHATRPPGADRIARGEYAAAIEECTEALKFNPKSADAYCHRARAHRALGHFDQALADANAAVQLEPRHAWAHRTLGDICLAQGNVKAALTHCDQAIRLDPGHAPAYNTRAGAFLLCNKLKEALADCNEAIRLAPRLWGAYITRANARYHLDDPNAAEDYQKSFELNPQGYARSVVMIIAEQVRQDLNLIFDNCAQHLKADPRDTISLMRRGMTLLLTGKDDEAKRDFDQAVLLNPSVQARVNAVIAEVQRLRFGAR